MGSLSVIPSGKALAADVRGVDLAEELDDATFTTILDAWSQHLVLRFRGQQLSDPQLERFSARLGALDRAPAYTAGTEVTVQSDFVTVISNVTLNGKPIGDLGNAEALWHTDMSYNELPPMASALYALEIPTAGGETGFCNMYLAYEALPAALKTRVVNLQCKHDSSRNSTGGLRRGQPESTTPHDAPGAVHPIVRTHPVTGRNALFLGRRLNGYVMGLAPQDSEALLDELWAHAAKPEFSWYQEWQLGDLILWDNRCVMHRRNAFDAAARRIMHRTQLAGDRPVHVRQQAGRAEQRV
ncbi:MAG: TauD/TfdA family dioxygenase [Betaproteobacteria bacterium]|nr:TauD/TfdA family dioxygenase [Betaproteobacteria bacterium]